MATQTPRRPKAKPAARSNYDGQEGDVVAGDGNEVDETGTAEIVHDGSRDVGAHSEQNRREQPGVWLREGVADGAVEPASQGSQAAEHGGAVVGLGANPGADRYGQLSRRVAKPL